MAVKILSDVSRNGNTNLALQENKKFLPGTNLQNGLVYDFTLLQPLLSSA